MDRVAIVVVAYRVLMSFHRDRNAPTRMLNHQLDCASDLRRQIVVMMKNQVSIGFSLTLR